MFLPQSFYQFFLFFSNPLFHSFLFLFFPEGIGRQFQGQSNIGTQKTPREKGAFQMVYRSLSQYRLPKGKKAKYSGVEASYEYTTGNEIGLEEKSTTQEQKTGRRD